MIFFLSKILWEIFNPFNLVIFLFILGIILNFINYSIISKIFFSMSLLLILLIGFFPSGAYLIYLLEKDYTPITSLPQEIDGILILGGATIPSLTQDHNQVALNGSAERITESINLMKKYPNTKIIFAGGSGSISLPKLSHSAVAKKLYNNLGLDTNNIFFDYESRNTFENILFAKKKFKNISNEKWIVVTSAMHLNRALNISEKMGLKFIPYPTDYKHPKKFIFKIEINLIDNFNQFQIASREWVGLIYYYLIGRTSKVY